FAGRVNHGVAGTALEGKEWRDRPTFDEMADNAFLVSEIPESKERLWLIREPTVEDELNIKVLRTVVARNVARIEHGVRAVVLRQLGRAQRETPGQVGNS